MASTESDFFSSQNALKIEMQFNKRLFEYDEKSSKIEIKFNFLQSKVKNATDSLNCRFKGFRMTSSLTKYQEVYCCDSLNLNRIQLQNSKMSKVQIVNIKKHN